MVDSSGTAACDVPSTLCHTLHTPLSCLDLAVISVLATGPTGCRFERGQGDGFFKGDKTPQHTFLSDGK
jgi:hypothetical protein